MGKFTKKLKKFAKKAAPLAMLGLGAAALMKRRKTNALNAIIDYDVSGGGDNRQALAKRLMTSDRAYTGKGYTDPIMTGGVGVKGPGLRTWDSYLPWNKKDGGRIGAKKGGRVTGIAKRGFGRALKKK